MAKIKLRIKFLSQFHLVTCQELSDHRTSGRCVGQRNTEPFIRVALTRLCRLFLLLGPVRLSQFLSPRLDSLFCCSNCVPSLSSPQQTGNLQPITPHRSSSLLQAPSPPDLEPSQYCRKVALCSSFLPIS